VSGGKREVSDGIRQIADNKARLIVSKASVGLICLLATAATIS
jgi:hypothetical protein